MYIGLLSDGGLIQRTRMVGLERDHFFIQKAVFGMVYNFAIHDPGDSGDVT